MKTKGLREAMEAKKLADEAVKRRNEGTWLQL